MRFPSALCFTLLLFSTLFSSALAQTSDDFYIRVFAGEDTEPPSTPTLLSATAISPTQIDLSWSVATDNFVLSGYIVERAIGTSSTSTIATTTLTSFSDTGLTASSSYTYSIRAFDSVGNYSTSSNSIEVITPNFPVTPTSTSASQSGTAARVVAEEVIVTPDISRAFFDITAALPARFEIRWGRTASYELGFVASDILRRDYSTVITDLEPGTRYEYEIIGYTPSGRSNVVERGKFQTLSDIDLTAPANVKRFTARSDGSDVALSWQLPDDLDIAYVRIVRSHLGYPMSPTDGAVVYQGLGGSAVDAGVLQQYSPAYYTAFVYDTAGNTSSGAITIAFSNDANSGSGGTSSRSFGSDGGDGVTIPTLEPLATTTQHMPDAFEILIKQANRESSFGEPQITLDSDEPFVVFLKADNVTQNLKSIIVRLQDPTDQRQSSSFLLRLNKDQTAYEAVVAPLNVAGKSSVVLSIYDFRALRVAEYRTELEFKHISELPSEADLKASDNQLLWRFLVSIFLLSLLLIGWLITKDRDDE